ncbi:Predicted phosphoesterase [Pedobacter nyackensis]|uniref:Predicted phosphoesterase n=2 Tax=Pedobacter nyackensis TaxID=475255 RepID=A0A1W2EHL0_9SPHI|nr:Predicted phosphoesterase [Pedobacter nyackensis]
MADIHLHEADSGRWSDCFKKVSAEAKVLIIAGDLTNTGDEAEAHILANLLKHCTIPVVAVLGNHDYEKGREKLIRQALQSQNVHILDGESVVIEGIGFAGIKGFGGGFDNHMLSMFGENTMKNFVQEAVNDALQLDRALARLDQEHEQIKKIAIMHYSPISGTVAGEPEAIYPFLGCSRLAEPLLRRKVLATFHGHAHLGTMQGRIGNESMVYNVAIPVLKKNGHDGYFTIDI